MKQDALRPEEQVTREHLGVVVVRHRHVVEGNECPSGQTGENLKYHVIEVMPGDTVCGVDEEHISGTQVSQIRRRHPLHRHVPQLYRAIGAQPLEEISREGIDTGDLDVAAGVLRRS